MHTASNPADRRFFNTSLLYTLLKSYLAAFALCNIGGISPADILSVLLFFAMLLLFSYSAKLTDAAVLPAGFSSACALSGALFTLFYMASEHKYLTGGFDSRLFRLFYVLATAAGLFFLFLACVRALMVLFSAGCSAARPARPLTARWKRAAFGGLLLCWLPWFLYNYPGVMTPDSISQFSQATGLIPYSSHHSLVHTLLFELFYRIGSGITGSVNAGIACYIIFQMLTLAAVETCCLSLLSEKGLPKWMLLIWFLFWGLIPYNGIYAVTMWKDVLFSAFVLLYALALYQLLSVQKQGFLRKNPDGQASSPAEGRTGDNFHSAADFPAIEHEVFYRRKSLRLYCMLFISGWLTCMLRSNGLYIFLFMLPFVLIAFRRRIKSMAALQLFILLLALLVKGPVFDHFGVAKPHFTESLSIPLQQVARVVTEGRSLTEEQEALINQVVDISLIPDYYDPVISDPIKALVIYNNADYLAEHKGEFLRLWAELLVKYPRDYMEAFIDQTRGYWYPAPADLRTNEGISPNEVGLAWPHLLRGQLPVKISEILLKMPDLFPVYGMLWSIGAFTWLMLFLFVFQFLYGERKYLLLYLPFIGTILTLLIATPVASDLRYAYPMFLGMPLMLSVPVLQKKGR